ncbi:polysaccharide deacetylase family protein [Deinococcus sp. Marseille-Q6407]|uniref:polysaccharide deacetylase family protein n=1 Tax=Deinococcus sp. Marseille-Q6407 TaxID=2969223 RepID=UPI0021C07229|nr:polysaccharide deacetylase family protein [Deinococcus sp. Marseille-Q6407]
MFRNGQRIKPVGSGWGGRRQHQLSWPGQVVRAVAAAFCLGAALLAPAALAQPDPDAPQLPAPLPFLAPFPPASGLPGQVQPVAPGTRPAPALPRLQLTPPIAQVFRTEYLSNGFTEVAHTVLTVTPQERQHLRPLAVFVARRVLAARPSLDEVDISVYDQGSYAGFGGPLPVLTASVPRARLDDFLAWGTRRRPYERVWVNPGNLPQFRQADRVLENVPLPSGAPASSLELQARRQGGRVGGLLYRGKDPSLPLAALTFDDAPHPLFEPLLLDLLRRSGTKATFFVIGRNATAYPYFIRDMVQQGHEVANHTYHHVRLPPLPLADAINEMRWTNTVLRQLTGKPVRYFRPPGGEYTPETLQAARALGLTTVFWTDDPGDFQNPGAATLQGRLQSKLRPGGIVLLHDNAPQMLEVLQNFLRVARQQGYHLTTVGGLPK